MKLISFSLLKPLVYVPFSNFLLRLFFFHLKTILKWLWGSAVSLPLLTKEGALVNKMWKFLRERKTQNSMELSLPYFMVFTAKLRISTENTFLCSSCFFCFLFFNCDLYVLLYKAVRLKWIHLFPETIKVLSQAIIQIRSFNQLIETSDCVNVLLISEPVFRHLPSVCLFLDSGWVNSSTCWPDPLTASTTRLHQPAPS